MQLTLAGFAVWQMRRTRKDTVTGDPAQFVAMVRTTPVALEMHPDDAEQQTAAEEEVSESGADQTDSDAQKQPEPLQTGS